MSRKQADQGPFRSVDREVFVRSENGEWYFFLYGRKTVWSFALQHKILS
uniref:Uncharacterized protein n=1 Tax=Anguilla anguilla TaxID=7936 RepID=A0A0E9XAS8_ANGAN